MKYKPGHKKVKGSGIQKGQTQKLPAIRRTVHDLLLEGGVHPVTELLKLIPQLSPKDAARVHLDLLQYIAPKLSAQQVNVTDERALAIDVTPKEVTTDELIKAASEGDKE